MRTALMVGMQAIETKYLGATDTRGSRIKAYCERGSLTVPYPNLDLVQCHVFAADQLVAKFVAEDEKQYGTPPEKNPWSRRRCTGGTSTGYAHVFIEETSQYESELLNACTALIASTVINGQRFSMAPSCGAWADLDRAIANAKGERP